MRIRDRIQHTWNAWTGNEYKGFNNIGVSSSYQGFKAATPKFDNESLASSIFNRIAIDAAMVDIVHVKIDPKTLNETKMSSNIQRCLEVEPNIDQNPLDFKQDLIYSMFDEGVVAVVPVETTINPNLSGSYDINSMRVGKITSWAPQHVTVRLYNERTGDKKELTLPKSMVAIIENPLYSVLSGPNSTLKRLISKLHLLDMQDNIVSGGKIDVLLQLPYAVKTERQKIDAEQKVASLTNQLNNNKVSIGWIDATDKITQLNRPIVTTLVDQVNQLKQELYNQIGLTENVFNGTASESEMRTYYSRAIDPILARIVSEFKRKFITKTGTTQGQSFVYRRDPFKLVPAEQLAAAIDTLSRNTIISPNEGRAMIGLPPDPDPKSDILGNRNIADANQGVNSIGSAASPDLPAIDLTGGQNGGNTTTEGEA